MAKRFTDTDKWKRPWFRQLSPKAKLVWFYILDNCDHCGVWPADFELLTFQTGQKVSREEFEDWFAGKFKIIDGDKYFFPSFVVFQQGHLSETKNAHKPIISFLEKYGLSLDAIPIPSPSHGDPILMGPSKGISKGKGKGNKGGAGGKTIAFPQELQESFDTFWQAYPHKVEKERARKNFARDKPAIADLLTALEKYKRHKPPTQAWKNPGTFISEYRSCLEPDYGQTQSSGTPHFDIREILGESNP